MKKEKKILISSVYNHLCKRDPEWNTDYMRDDQFKALYDAWSDGEMKKGLHSDFFYISSWKRGWLPIADYKRWRKYAMQ